MSNRRLFISDVHIGAGRLDVPTTTHPYDWDWLTEPERENFVRFLDFLRTDYRDQYREIVVLGDLFDNWIFPHDQAPPSISALIEAPCNQEVCEALRRLSEAVPVLYVPGNHDMFASRKVMARYFPEITYCPQQFVAGRMIAEHGHRYAMFNAAPTFTPNIMGLPLGYFLSRIEATRKALTDSDARHYRTYVDDALELMGRQTLSQCVLEALLEEAELDEDTEFTLRRHHGDVTRVTASRVKEVYRDLYDDWPDNVVSKPRAVFAELDRLEPIADRLCKHGRYKVCVMGHSHKAALDRDTWFCDDRIYANAGFWCGHRCTLVAVDKRGGGQYAVSLGRWRDDDLHLGEPKTV
jgi:UDP-2,3-diacylglucosamine pyrophosphatase LpxH